MLYSDLMKIMPTFDWVKWIQPLHQAMAEFHIDTPLRQSAFIAQLAHESQEFHRLEEDLYYTRPERILAVWPRRFASIAEARSYTRNPEALANRVYSRRMGNGDEASGDGWRYRGRGCIQLTGRDNYRQCGTALGLDLIADPDQSLVPLVACRAAAWFWAAHGLNLDADKGWFERITRKINGGLNGMKERREYYERALTVTGARP